MIVVVVVVVVIHAVRMRVLLSWPVTVRVGVFMGPLRWITLVDTGPLRRGLRPTLGVIFILAAVCWVSRVTGIGYAVHSKKLSPLNTYWQLNENGWRWVRNLSSRYAGNTDRYPLAFNARTLVSWP